MLSGARRTLGHPTLSIWTLISRGQLHNARRILRSCGTEDEVAEEAHIDYFTGLTGSGPAIPALLASVLMEDAVSRGIDRRIARNSVVALLVGTGRLFDRRPALPTEVVAAFLRYRGPTAAAIDAMREHGFEHAVREGLAAALGKATERRERREAATRTRVS